MNTQNGSEAAQAPPDAPAGQPHASRRQRGEPCACGQPLTGKQQDYCSQKCRTLTWDAAHPRIHKATREQRRLPFRPALELVQLIGPTPEDIRRSQKAQTVKVLRMLQAAGPHGVTTHDFLAAGIGRFGARVGELRAVLWAITMTKLTPHSALYVLTGREGR